jgi:hypothetical protein
MSNDNVVIKWANVGEYCRVSFLFPKEDQVWTLERDIAWHIGVLYDIKEKEETLLHLDDARKLWKLLCKEHTFYKKAEIPKDED